MADVVIYALYGTDGVCRKAGSNLNDVTNHFTQEISDGGFWNDLWNAGDSGRVAVFKKNGWIVKKGYFTAAYIL